MKFIPVIYKNIKTKSNCYVSIFKHSINYNFFFKCLLKTKKNIQELHVQLKK